MLIMLLLFDLVRLVLGTDLVSSLDFLASRPVSRSRDPSLGLFGRVPGWARREALGTRDPLVGILDMLSSTDEFSG